MHDGVGKGRWQTRKLPSLTGQDKSSVMPVKENRTLCGAGVVGLQGEPDLLEPDLGVMLGFLRAKKEGGDL